MIVLCFGLIFFSDPLIEILLVGSSKFALNNEEGDHCFDGNNFITQHLKWQGLYIPKTKINHSQTSNHL